MILLIEDNLDIAHNIKTYLELNEFSVDHKTDGIEGLAQAEKKHYDCIILDIMLPGKNWFEILEDLRINKGIPVILTTAKWTIEDKSKWFELWADDYLVKPFELKELLMRIEAILKRTQTSDIITIWNIHINLEDNNIKKDGEDVHLPLKERQILTLLIDAGWHPVERTTIIEDIRGSDAMREKNDWKLDVYISNLRKKLDKSLIETVKWFGYKWNQEK